MNDKNAFLANTEVWLYDMQGKKSVSVTRKDGTYSFTVLAGDYGVIAATAINRAKPIPVRVRAGAVTTQDLRSFTELSGLP